MNEANLPAFEETQPMPQAHPEGGAPAGGEALPSFEETQPVEQYESAGEKLKTGLEGAARGLSFGLSDVAAQKMRDFGEMIGVDPDLLAPKVEDIAARKEINPGTSLGGEMAGQLLGFTTGTGAPGLISKVGQAGAEAANLGKVGSAVVRGAIEGGLLQGGDEISRAMLGQGDPEAPVASALAHIGAGALFGGALGGAFGAAGAALNRARASKAGAEVAKIVEDFGARHALQNATPEELVLETATSRKLPSLQSDFQKTMEAGEHFDVPVMNGLVSADRGVRMAEDAMLHGPPSIPNVRRQALYEKAYNKVVDTIAGILPDFEYSKAAAGEQIQSGVVNRIQQAYEPIQAVYDEISKLTPNIPLSPRSAPAIRRAILSMKELTQMPDSPQARLGRAVAENILNAKTVEDIAFQKRAIAGMANSTIPEERRFAALLAAKMNVWQERAVEKYVSRLQSLPTGPNMKPVIERLKELTPMMREARAQYKPFIENVSRISEELGKGRVHGPEDAMQFIRDMDFEALTKKLARKDNSQFRAWFQQQFPDEMEALRLYQKSAFKKAASRSGEFSAKTLTNQIMALEPEIRESIFTPEELKTIELGQHYLKKMQDLNFNPSGTSHMSAFRAFFESLKGAALGNVRDWALHHFVVGEDLTPALKKAIGRPVSDAGAAATMRVVGNGNTSNLWQALDYVNKIERGSAKISKGVENLFQTGGQAVISELANEKARAKLKKYVEEGKLNDEILEDLNQSRQTPGVMPEAQPQGFAHGGEVLKKAYGSVPPPAEPVTQHQNAIAEHFPAQNMMLEAAKGRINNYLNSIRPQSSPMKLPFDAETKDRHRERKYNQALDLANEPLTILNEIKRGTLTPESMQHFTSMYPELYSHLSKKITDRITKAQMSGEKPPFQLRQSLSMFLNAPLDSSMTPKNIMSAQKVFMGQKQAKAEAAEQAPKPGHNKKNTATLSKAPNAYKTPAQTRETRDQNAH